MKRHFWLKCQLKCAPKGRKVLTESLQLTHSHKKELKEKNPAVILEKEESLWDNFPFKGIISISAEEDVL